MSRAAAVLASLLSLPSHAAYLPPPLERAASAPDAESQAAELRRLFDNGLPGVNANRDRMLSALDFIKDVFKAAYAPAAWKARYAGWDLDKEVEKAKAELLAKEKPTVKDFQRAAKKIFDSTKDYHVGIGYFSTESAILPFMVRGSGGRYFIVHIDREKLPEESFPFKEGDELIEFGGRPAAAAVAELKASLGGNTDVTDEALASIFLTRRRAERGAEVPSEPVTIAVKSKDGKISSRQLAWDYTPENIPEPRLNSTPAPAGGIKFRMDDMLSPLAKDNPHWLGVRQSFIPALGEKLWESAESEPFHAYLYRSGGKVIGYVRIPSYGPEDVGKAVAHFGTLMGKFEKTADALVIDQVNNPGGGVFYLYTLASMLSEQALKTPRHRIAITQAEAAFAAELLALEPKVTNDAEAKKALGAEINGYPTSYQVFRHIAGYARFILKEWAAGKTLTEPYWLYGVDQINPSAVARFTKPVLLITNELDFSGGDFFPAILQDNKRVTVFGARTAGAGGYVMEVKFPNRLGIASFNLTGSIAERVDGNPIENLGVKPDVEYALTEKDYQEGFAEYVKAINAAVSGLSK